MFVQKSINITLTELNSSILTLDIMFTQKKWKQGLFGTWNNLDWYFGGTLEEVGIWNKVISSAERDFLWNDGKGREIVFCEWISRYVYKGWEGKYV